MPENAAMVKVRGMDDLAVEATLDRLQEARAHADPSPYGEEKPAAEK